MRFVSVALLLLLPAGLCAQEPAPKQSVDTLVEQIGGIRKARADLDKQESAALMALRTELKRQNDLIEKLGLNGPGPVVPPKPVDPPDIVPPKPPAPPPVPVDPLRVKLKAAFDASMGGTGEKVEWAKDLAALYRAAAKLVNDPRYATASALKAKLKEAADEMLKENPTALMEVRKAVAVELAGVLPTTDGELTSEQRANAAGLLKKLADILDGM